MEERDRSWVDDFGDAWGREYPQTEDTSGLRIVALLARLSILTVTFEQETLEAFDLMPSDYAVLAALRRAGSPYELAPSDLSTGLYRSSGGMTKMLKRLEKLQYIRRVPDPQDGRGKLVRLTPKGKKVEEEAFAAFITRTHELLQFASQEEFEMIDQAVRRLLEIIESNYHP